MRRLNWTLVWLMTVGIALVQAAELRDVSWKCKGANDCSLVYQFNPAMGLPSYFQKYDSERQVLRVAFSSTSITIDPNAWVIQPNATGLRSLMMKSETTSKGTPLLVFEWSVGKDIHVDNNPVSLEKDGCFIIKLSSHSPKMNWDLVAANKKLLKSKPVIAPAPIAAKASHVKAPIKQEIKPAVAPAPVASLIVQPEVTQDASMKGASLPQGLAALSWQRGYGVEQFVVQFSGLAPKDFHLTDSTLVIPLPKASHPCMAVSITSSVLVREMHMVKEPISGYDLVFKLKGTPLQVLSHGARIWIQANSVTPPGLEVWNMGTTGVQHHLYDASSNDDELQSLDQFAQGISKAPMSTSQTFLLRKGSRDLIVVEESVVLRDAPNEVGKQLLVLKFGDRLQCIDLEDLYYKVKVNGVSGFVNRRMVSYPDELSHVQSERLEQLASAQKTKHASADSAGISDSALSFDNPDEDRITYSSFGRRDPFIELKGVVNAGINIDGVELVGIIWDAEVPMVLLTDSRNPGVSYTLKEGDSILNGKVLKITQDEVLFLINEFGVSRRYTMTLPDKYGGKK